MTETQKEQTEAAYWRGYYHGYQTGYKEGTLTPQQRAERACRMQGLIYKRITDPEEPTNGQT